MESLERRSARWLGIVGELLQQQHTVFPHAIICQELSDSFDVVAVSWDWRDSAGSIGFEIFPPSQEWASQQITDTWQDPELLAAHPLMRWFATTRDCAPQTIGRVPATIASLRDHAVIHDLLRSTGCEQQLSIPYRLVGIEHREFLLARSDRDFSEDDLELSRRLAPIFRALDLQVQVLGGLPTRSDDELPRDRVDLTGRELAVLRLLAEGLTAFSVARRLTISPRTVHKHQEHIYRKLGVADRLSAVRVAQRLGLVCGVPSLTPSRTS